jgi:hypothetical protein
MRNGGNGMRANGDRAWASRVAAAVGLAMLMASVALNVYLASKVRRLEEPFLLPRALKVGALVPRIRAKTLDGREAEVGGTALGSPTVFYVFRPGCEWCLRNVPSLRRLLQERGSQYRFVGLSLSSLGVAEYLKTNRLPLATYVDLPSDFVSSFGIQGTPQTIVASKNGRVLQNWAGAYKGTTRAEVSNFFHVPLPRIPTD